VETSPEVLKITLEVFTEDLWKRCWGRMSICMTASREGGGGGDGQDLAFAVDCLLLVQDMEGCSSHVRSKNIAWSEISSGGASG